MKNKFEELLNDINNEIKQIEKVIEVIVKEKNQLTSNPPSITQKTAFAGYLMNFYNGIENILKQISKRYYKKFPSGEAWHKDLLKLCITPPNKTLQIFNKTIIDELYNYLGFRHFFIHGYSFKIKWEELEILINNIERLWSSIKNEINNFSNKLKQSS
jgi:hypothetical protein